MEAPAYQLLHRSIDDKNVVQAKHIRKVEIPVLLHRMVIKFLEIELESWTERKNKTAVAASSARRKVGSFQRRKISYFLQSSTASSVHQKSLTTGRPIIASQ